MHRQEDNASRRDNHKHKGTKYQNPKHRRPDKADHSPGTAGDLTKAPPPWARAQWARAQPAREASAGRPATAQGPCSGVGMP